MTSTHPTGDLEPVSAPGTRCDARTQTGGSVVRSLLWLLLVIGMAANTVASIAGVATPVHLGLGVVTTACAAALIVQFLRHRS